MRVTVTVTVVRARPLERHSSVLAGTRCINLQHPATGGIFWGRSQVGQPYLPMLPERQTRCVVTIGRVGHGVQPLTALWKMGIVFNNAALSSTTGDSDSVKYSRRRKVRPAMRDLPFPRGAIYVQLWRNTFVPALLAWAGAQEDAFGTNGKLESMGQIGVIWENIYPDIALNDKELKIVVNVVRLPTQE